MLRLLIILANSLDPDQARQIVKTFCHSVGILLKEFLKVFKNFENVNFENKDEPIFNLDIKACIYNYPTCKRSKNDLRDLIYEMAQFSFFSELMCSFVVNLNHHLR